MRVALSFVVVGLLVCSAPEGASAGPTPRRIEISVTKAGFSPKRVSVKKGEPITLVFTRKTEQTCAKDVAIYIDDANTISLKLPLNQPAEVTTTFRDSGERGFACSMKMHGGAIMVE